jgi:hypothetical protein
MTTGVLFLSSLFFLSLVVCAVYTMAVEVQTTPSQLFRSILRRLGRLAGVLAALALLVFFFSLV